LLILRKYSRLPSIVKGPFRLMLHWFWRIRYVIDRLCSRKFKQIVICGYPRGGTSLLYNMICTSVNGFYYDEFESLSIERIHRYGNYITKSPVDILNIAALGELNKFDKEIYVLIVVRDIRDVITSKHPMLPNEFFIGYDNSWWPSQNDFSRWVYDGPGVVDIDNAIKESEKNTGINIVKIKYEQIIFDVDGLQKDLESLMGISFARPMRLFFESKSKMAYKYEGQFKANDLSLVLEDKPINTSRAGKWKKPEYEKRVRDQFTKCPELFDILIRDGYEVDKLWFESYN
jgi:hypothetical protein